MNSNSGSRFEMYVGRAEWDGHHPNIDARTLSCVPQVRDENRNCVAELATCGCLSSLAKWCKFVNCVPMVLFIVD